MASDNTLNQYSDRAKSLFQNTDLMKVQFQDWSRKKTENHTETQHLTLALKTKSSLQ